ncbi:MAG: DUF4232 domain-containing protein [Acidobacteriota bacterium]|nr:DUF4232 domain-containing protein [Acidobacteriota bacterium]
MAVAAACSSPADHGATTTTPPTSGVASSTSTSAAAGGALAHCQPSDLAGTLLGSQGAAGTIEITIALRNATAAPCALEGYPGMALVDAAGNQLPSRVVPGGSLSFDDFGKAPVTIGPGQSAYFNVGYSDVPAGGESSCPTSASLWVTPPDDVTHLVVPARLTVCDGGTLTTSPLFAQGSPETQTTAPAA